MTMKSAARISIAGLQLAVPRHVCAFFSSEDETYRVLSPFIAEGFECGHKAVHILRPDHQVMHLQRLAEMGIDVQAARARGQLELRHNTDTYLPEGIFDAERMYAAFEAIANGKKGYPLSRIVCNMDWASGEPPLFEDLMRFEASVNSLWSRHDDVVICAYDVNRLSGDMVINIMRTHPMVLIDGLLQENPFFVPPEKFLLEWAGGERTGWTSS